MHVRATLGRRRVNEVAPEGIISLTDCTGHCLVIAIVKNSVLAA